MSDSSSSSINSSDFRAPLNRFLEHTSASSRIPIVSQVRYELVFRYRVRMEAQTLIQTSCRLYLSSKLPALELTADKKKELKIYAGFPAWRPRIKASVSTANTSE